MEKINYEKEQIKLLKSKLRKAIATLNVVSDVLSKTGASDDEWAGKLFDKVDKTLKEIAP